MKGSLKFCLTLILIFLSGILSNSDAQTRNPVIEFCTGTWCQWCPCGDITIENLLEDYPNLIPVAYHGPVGYDPFANFPGNQIIGLMGFTGYPTATVDRSSALGDYTTWTNKVISRVSVPATLSINMNKSFDEGTGQLDVTVTMTPLQDLTGQYKYNIILTEDSLIADQINNGVCGGGGVGWVHYWVVRAMINGAAGEDVNSSSPWLTGDAVSKTVSYTVPSTFNFDKCNLTVFVYKQNSPMYMAEIQQGEQWGLTENIVPVELTSFSGSVKGNDVLLNWSTATETNNQGFEIQRKSSGEFSTVGFIKGSGTSTESHLYSFTDNDLNSGIYLYRLKQVDFDGSVNYSKIIEVSIAKPSIFGLSQNYPNPFNPTTTINYSISSDAFTTLKVYDMLGREVATLVNSEKPSGDYEVEFNAASFPSGIYFYKLQAGSFVQTRKMIVLK